MSIMPAFNFKKWIDENREHLKPPVCNKLIWKDQDFIVMVIGGPNTRDDYHVNQGEEFFYQLEGDINLKIMENGRPRDIPIKEGEVFLLPGGIPHSPQRTEGSVGLVVEHKRPEGVKDGFKWFCPECHTKLYEDFFILTDIENQLPACFKKFYSEEKNRTCSACGFVLDKR